MASKLPLVVLLIATTCLSQFYRVSNSVIAPELTRDLGLSARQLGWAGSAFFFALFAVQIAVAAAVLAVALGIVWRQRELRTFVFGLVAMTFAWFALRAVH